MMETTPFIFGCAQKKRLKFVSTIFHEQMRGELFVCLLQIAPPFCKNKRR